VIIGSLRLRPGESAPLPVVLRTGGFQVSSTSNEIDFDPIDADFPSLPNGTPDCLAATGLGSAFRYRPQGCTGTDCVTLFASVLPLTFPFNPIPDGTVIYSCRVLVPESAVPGTYPLLASDVVVGDLQGARIAGAIGIDGEVVVLNRCVGDCNGDGEVTVEEIVRIVNIALGAESIDACPAADADGSGTITVDEIVTAVGNALNGCRA
jgi:hypothetical protein